MCGKFLNFTNNFMMMQRKYFLALCFYVFCLGVAVAQDTIWYTENGKRKYEIYKGEENDKRNFRTFVPRFGFGFNTLSPSTYPTKLISSRFWTLGGQYRHRISSEKAAISLGVGLEFSWNNLRFDGSEYPSKTATELVWLQASQEPSRNKLTLVNIGVPILVYKTFDNWRIGVGGYGDFMLSSYTKLRYKDSNGENIENKTFSDFYTNRFRYGLQVEAKYKFIRFFGKYDLQTLFQSGKAQDTRIIAFGIGI
jgi:hypothetical protein